MTNHCFACVPAVAVALATITTGAAAGAPAVTFAEHIAPMVYSHCSTCHHKDSAAPFSLVTYAEVSKRARTMQAVIDERYMPPWKPVPGHGQFKDERRLTDAQIALFKRWVELGRPEGDPSKAPAPPKFADGWTLGKPDLVVEMKQSFDVAADGPDVYRCFVLPLDLPEDKWIRAVEFRPSARSVVHHSLFFIDSSGEARKLDGEDGQPGFRGMRFRVAGRLGGYVPGATPNFLPDGLAMHLPKGSDIVLQTHFHPVGKAEVEKSGLAIYFADEPPSRTMLSIQVPPGFGVGAGIDIPAGEKRYTVEDTFTLPAAIEAFQISGHAHYICQEMRMTATPPGGAEQPLLYINDWDLDWQDNYEFKQPVRLPEGTVIKTTLVYDNSSQNPDNPFSPPRRVRWGRESTDEMGSVTLIASPVNERDAAALNRAVRLHNAKAARGALASEEVRKRIAQRVVERFDRNKDGKVQTDEIPERIRDRAFKGLDLNNDGEVTVEELIEADGILRQFRDR